MRNPSRSTEAESVRVLREARELGWTEERIRRAIGFGRGEHRYIVDRVVDPEEFLGAGYLNAVDQDGNSVVYPAVREAYVEICSGAYDECVLSGAIGVGKTQLAVYIQAYELYKLLCFRSPHAAFALDPSSEITIAFQSLSLELSEDGAFQRLRKLIDAAPVFQGTEFRYDPAKKSQLAFRNNIVVKPVSGEEAGTLGQNLISGVLDELNHMAYVEHSKRTRDQGAYDQAQALYDAIRRRRQSRFMRDGQLPGMLCLVSSKRYPGEFTERKAAEARQPGSRVYLYDKKIWEVKPSAYGTARFRVFSGDFTRPPRILRKDETMPGDEDRILAVPIELRADFERDLPGALRDLGGVSTQVCSPFLPNRSAVAAIFRKAPQILSRTETDFVSSGLTVPAGAWRSTEQFPRYVHLDLSRSQDSTGIAIAHVPRFIRLARTGEELPVIRYDVLLEVRPPRGGEIDYARIRAFLYNLYRHGLPIRWVTTDSYQSTDMLQRLEARGFMVGEESTDRSTRPYEFLKQAIYDGRVEAPRHDKAYKELVELELEAKKNRIDHPPHGSKDLADAMACVALGLTLMGQVWIDHGVNPASWRDEENDRD